MRHCKALAIIGINTVVLTQFISVIHAHSGATDHDRDQYTLVLLDKQSCSSNIPTAESTLLLINQKAAISGNLKAKPTDTIKVIEAAEDEHPVAVTGFPASVAIGRGRQIRPRAVGDVVVATVDDVAVSWINTYEGTDSGSPISSISQADGFGILYGFRRTARLLISCQQLHSPYLGPQQAL